MRPDRFDRDLQPGQRERVHHRPGPRLEMEVVETTQHTLRMRRRRDVILCDPLYSRVSCLRCPLLRPDPANAAG